jgi:hypothetical protein
MQRGSTLRSLSEQMLGNEKILPVGILGYLGKKWGGYTMVNKLFFPQ